MSDFLIGKVYSDLGRIHQMLFGIKRSNNMEVKIVKSKIEMKDEPSNELRWVIIKIDTDDKGEHTTVLARSNMKDIAIHLQYLFSNMRQDCLDEMIQNKYYNKEIVDKKG